MIPARRKAVIVKMNYDERTMLESIATADGTNLSTTIRLLVLAEYRKRAKAAKEASDG